MYIKKKGYILINAMALLLLFILIILSGSKIIKMNIGMSNKYKTSKSIKDIDNKELDKIKKAEEYLGLKGDLLEKQLENDFEENTKNGVKIKYTKENNFFELEYEGVPTNSGVSTKQYIYCDYEFITKDKTKTIILFPKRRF